MRVAENCKLPRGNTLYNETSKVHFFFATDFALVALLTLKAKELQVSPVNAREAG
jgi:hypothetical protein